MRIPLLLLVLPCIYYSAAQAQTGFTDTSASTTRDYNFVQYNSENGLPQNSVNDLLLDKNHFLWIATHNGLVRFDGQRFRIYNSSNTPILQSNRFPLLSETAGREVLVKSSFDDSVIYAVNPDYAIIKEPVFTRLKRKLISYHSNGVFDYDRLMTYFTGKDTGRTRLLDQLYNAGVFWVFNAHEAVIAWKDNYYYLNSEDGGVRKLPGKFDAARSPKSFVIGDVFCIAETGGSFFFYKQGRPVDIQADSTVNRLFQGYEKKNMVQFFLHVKGGRTVLRKHNDFYKLQISGLTLKATILFRNLNFLENQPIYSLEYDSTSSILFLGSQNIGLLVVRPRLFRTIGFKSMDYSNNSFMAAALLPNDRILTNNGILDQRDRAKDHLFASNERLDRYCIFQARDGALWCTRDKRLLRSDPKFLKVLAADSTQLESYITCMTEDTGGGYWISTLHSLLKWERGRLRPVLIKYPSFMDHSIESVAEVSAQKLWIASRNGLYEFDKRTEKINPRPILADTYVRSIYKDREGEIWIGTYGSGYLRYKGGRFFPMPLDPERYLAASHAFLEDDNGFLWISTNHGLFKVLKAELEHLPEGQRIEPFLYYYDRSSGFETNEFNGGCNPAAMSDSSGHFYFPSMNGIVAFSPDSCRGELPDKPLYIDEFRVDSNLLDYHASIAISPEFGRLLVQVATPFYGARENLRMEYSFNQGDWYPLNPDGKIIINRLPYGKYSLVIRKKNGWGKNNTVAITLPFEVQPHWYNKPLFWVVLWVWFLWLVVQVRTRFLRNQNNRLQMKVDERTFELEKSTLMREKLFSVIMHDIRSPLYAQNLLIELLTQQDGTISEPRKRQLLTELMESNKNILRFSSDFLVWYDSQKEDFSVHKTRLVLRPFIEEILQFFQPVTDSKGLMLAFDAGPELEVTTDKQLLGIILRNIIDNAIKHTSSGGIHVRVYAVGGRVAIKVQDTGSGMNADKIRELTEMQEGGKSIGQSFGYRFIREFSGLLGAELSIVSHPGIGTRVIVSL